jgi:hypothetical protein
LDRSLKALAPGVPETERGRLAVQFARTLAFSSLAEQQGLAKNPELAKEIETQMKILRTRILASAYLQNLQRQSVIAPAEIEKYYNEHLDEFEQAQVLRLSVPVSVPTEAGVPLDRSAVKSEMEELRKRAANGEDFNLLQQDAYRHLHIQATPPAVIPLTLRRGDLQGDEKKAFDLKPGEISDVLDAPAAAVIVKLQSKNSVPMGSVRQEIEGALRREILQQALSKLSNVVTAQFDLQYLNLLSQPDLFAMNAVVPAAGGSAAKRALAGRRPIRPGATPMPH